jgi:hypothetical protein
VLILPKSGNEKAFYYLESRFKSNNRNPFCGQTAGLGLIYPLSML